MKFEEIAKMRFEFVKETGQEPDVLILGFSESMELLHQAIGRFHRGSKEVLMGMDVYTNEDPQCSIEMHTKKSLEHLASKSIRDLPLVIQYEVIKTEPMSWLSNGQDRAIPVPVCIHRALKTSVIAFNNDKRLII